MLTQRQKVAIRRHLGVPFASTAQAGRLFGWRFAIHVEDLEWKMSNLQPNEEQLITGLAMGTWQVMGDLNVGDVLTFQIVDTNGTHTTTYTVLTSDLTPPPNLINPAEGTISYSVALGAAAKINSAFGALGYQVAGVMPADIPAPPFQNPLWASIVITGPSSKTFTISGSATNRTILSVIEPVAPSPVAASVSGVQLYGYVPILDALAMRPIAADISLWIEKADVVTFRKDEVTARRQPYRYMCEMLSRDLGGREYVSHFFGGSRGGATA